MAGLRLSFWVTSLALPFVLATPAHAQGNGGGDVGTQGVCLEGCEEPPPGPTYEVRVTPDGNSASAVVGVNTTASFTVSNRGSTSLTLSFACDVETSVDCVSVSPTSATVASLASTNVTVTYRATTPGSNYLGMEATSTKASDFGWYSVYATDSRTAPLVDASHHNGENVDVSRCVLDCLHATLSYTTPAYYSFDTPRSATLLYRSEQARPMPFVQVEAMDTSSTAANQFSIGLRRRWDGQMQTLMGGHTEVHYTRHASGANRLAAQFDGTAFATGAYGFDVIVKSHWTGVPSYTRETVIPVTVLVVNEKDSPFGWGWSMPGLQRVHLDNAHGANGVLVTEGDGSAVFFSGSCSFNANCTFTAPAGDFSTLSYNHGASTIFRQYPDGTTAAFHADGKLAHIQDRFGNQTLYTWDWANNRLSSIRDPANLYTTFGYGSDGRLDWVQTPDGRRSNLTVNTAGNVTAIQDPLGGHPLQAMTYQPSNHLLISYQDRRGSPWNFGYDLASRLSSITAPSVDIDGDPGNSVRPVTTFFSGERRLWQTNSPTVGTYGSPRGARNSAHWYHHLASPRGVVTLLYVNRWSQPVRVRVAHGTPLLQESIFEYTANGLLTQTRSPSGRTIGYTWNGANLTQVNDVSTGKTTNYTYDATRYNAVSRVHGTGPEIDYFLNSNGLPDSLMVANDTRVKTHFTYDPRGRITTQRDAEGHTTSWLYQTSGFYNTQSVTAPGNRVTTYHYDAAGRDTAFTAPGVFRGARYDALNRVDRARNGGVYTYYAYTDSSLIVTDPLSNVHTFQYDALGRLDWERDPLDQTIHYGYDLVGNLIRVTNRRGQVVTFAYDTLNNLRSRAQQHENVTTTYSAAANGSRMVANLPGVSVDTLNFDIAGRPVGAVTRRGTHRHVSSYGYNAQGLLNQITFDPHGAGSSHVSQYVFNSFNQLRQVISPFQGGAPDTLGYNEDRQAVTFTNTDNDVRTNRVYPSTHRNAEITFEVNGAWSSALNGPLGRRYEQDDAGRNTRRWSGLSSSGEADSVWYYTYDNLGHLELAEYFYVDCVQQLQFSSDDGWQSTCGGSQYYYRELIDYGPDALGNVRNGGTIGDGNRLLTSAGGWTYEYDLDGNLKAKKLNGVAQATYAWNSLGQLTSVWRTGVGTTSYAYDGFGQRVKRTAPNGTVTHYVYDRGNLIAELNASGVILRSYTYYPGGLDAVHSMRDEVEDTTYYYVREAPNNVTALLDEEGQLANRYDYRPYGDLRILAETVTNPLRFAGREWDGDAGLVYMRARWYDPALRRFISEDPIGLAGGLNVYAFAGANPAGYADPTGLAAVDCESGKINYGPDNDYPGADGDRANGYGLEICSGGGWPVAAGSGIDPFGRIYTTYAGALYGSAGALSYKPRGGQNNLNDWESGYGSGRGPQMVGDVLRPGTCGADLTQLGLNVAAHVAGVGILRAGKAGYLWWKNGSRASALATNAILLPSFAGTRSAMQIHGGTRVGSGVSGVAYNAAKMTPYLSIVLDAAEAGLTCIVQ